MIEYKVLILRREVNNLPNIKSAIKRVKVTQKKNLRNRMIKSAMRTQLKKFDTAVSANQADATILSATQGAVDKALAKGVIHKNAANRKKARLAKRLAKAAAAQ
jgi:small subunit ribosomal protein S20